MSNKIETVDLEVSVEESNMVKLSETYWKDYLKEKNYNTDSKKMCDICIKDQIAKYGKQTIICSGLNSIENRKEGFESIAHNFSEEEITELNALYNPYDYMKVYLDYDKKVKSFQDRFYQRLILSCSARYKVVRMGRRTGKSRSIAMLAVHKAITADNSVTPYRILLVSPYAVQTEEVINSIIDICNNLPDKPLANSKQTPAWKLTFTNGTILMGFTASTNGDQIRGQPADLIILDETDDIPAKAITSIMGIKMQNPDVEVWRSGTPKGEKNLHNAEQDQLAKSFHYPSYVIPQYSDIMDASLRTEMGEGIGYIEEVLAEISSGSNQVYQTLFLNRAKNKPYFITALDVLQDRQRYTVTIGVDWNHDKVGSRIVVIAYDKIVPQFTIIDKERVAIEGFTQHEAVERIISLNRKYNCDHVFVDKGFGTTQVAAIKKFALSQVGIVPKGHPDLKLLDITPIDFGSSTEVIDPISGEIHKTPTKQMAVLNSVEILEKDLLTLHPTEDHDIILQFKNYVEKSRNKGRITYGYVSAKIGDHDLDAIIIALFGMKKIYSSLFVSESTQALITYANKEENKEKELSDSVDLIFGLSFGRKTNKNSNRTNFNSSGRVVGFTKKMRNSF